VEVKNKISGSRCVWIQDNNLIMVPNFLRKQWPEANIGVFFHSPFPSSDIFRMFPFRFEVLKSLLSADLIGFHLFEYARNFFKTCHRLLGLDYEFRRGGYLGVNFHGRSVMIRVGNFGIDDAFIAELT